MARPAKWSSAQGLLLVEAVLSAVVIAVGLVFISRGLGGQLASARRIADRSTQLLLLQSTLAALEAHPLNGLPLDEASDGLCAPPHVAYRWRLAAAPRADLTDVNGAPLADEVQLTIARDQPPGGAVTLTALWPASWFSEQ